jgi:hypothetical protein
LGTTRQEKKEPVEVISGGFPGISGFPDFRGFPEKKIQKI